MKTILLIEDNRDLRENISEMLDLAGYKTETASNGKLGLEKAQTLMPDLIICDVMMPVLDGFSVLRILSNNSVTAGIPFIFLTAKAEKSDFRKGMSLGADDYITKPFDESDLLNAVELRLKKTEMAKHSEEASSFNDFNSFFNDEEKLEELKEMSQNFDSKNLRKKEIIFSEGSHSNGLYYIQKGKIKTYKTNDDGKEYITGLHKEGDFLGYVALLENTPHTEGAETLEDSEISIIPKQDFLKLVYNNAEVSHKFIRMLSHNLKEKEERLLALAYNSVRQRVAEALIHLQKKYQNDPKEKFSISFTREDLANMVGTATESLIRTLSDFKDEGAIEIHGSTIGIKDKGKLERIIS
ncbi:transcriptional regulator [Bacteroidota bacterium]|nr:transcriptional regulator [Bacteroidota bacterium]